MKASITYNAQGENKVLEAGGYTFFDGKATDVYDPQLIETLKNNRFFKVGTVDEHAEKPTETQGDHPDAPSGEGRAHQGQGKR
jgi:hypothetical protein